MRGREITSSSTEWYDALSKQLKRGETLEEHLENLLDEMCNQLPQREYQARISHELWAEQQRRRRLGRPPRRFCRFHVTEKRHSDYILAEENLRARSEFARRLAKATSAAARRARPTLLSKRCCTPSGSLVIVQPYVLV